MWKRTSRAGALILALLLVGALTVWAAETAEDRDFLPDGAVRLTFDANGGSGELPEAVTVQAGQSVVLPGAQLAVDLESEYWRFAGWADAPADEVPDYLPGSSFTVTDDLRLYAVYAEGPCQITYLVGDDRVTEEVEAGERPAQVPRLSGDWAGWWDARGRDLDPGQTAVWWDQTFVAYRAVHLDTQDHTPFMDGADDGLFYPDRSMTRAEAVQVLYALMGRPSGDRTSYSDVDPDAWYADGTAVLGGMGLLDCLPGQAFRPDDPITRGELAVILSHFLPREEAADVSFPDLLVQDPAYEAIRAASAAGLFSGYPDGTFRPEAAVTRAQAAAVFNQLLGREPDAQAIAVSGELRIFPDVSPDYWGYTQIMEATVAHDYTAGGGGEVWTRVEPGTTPLADGYYHFGERLYRVLDGRFLRSTTVDGFTFDAQGRYTTGSADLDEQLLQIIRDNTDSSMSQLDKLRALYNYVRDNFTYLRRDLVSQGDAGWEPAYAAEFLELGRGNCYSFSALFCLLARQLGYPAETAVGYLGTYSDPHGWVEIEMDGVTYMFDPQLEWRYLYDYGRGGYDLFMFRPGQVRFLYLR